MKQKLPLKILTGFLFLILLAIGFVLAVRKPLWNDEIFTQTRNIDQASYAAILTGKIVEGNNCPIFYLIQKGVCDLVQYRFPKVWDSREWEFSDLRSQLILRIMPNIFTAGTLAIIFYFFARYYSFGAGVYGLLVALSSLMVWGYWVEARPYPLWFFLTIVQSMLFILLMRKEFQQERLWAWLTLVNILLSLTVIFGVVQTLLISFLLYVWLEKRPGKYLWFAAVPTVISLFYYFQTLKLKFFVPDHPMNLIYANLPLDRALIFLFFGIVLGVYSFKKRQKTQPVDFGESRPYFVFSLMMIATALGFLLIFKLIQPLSQEGVFQLPHRYFFYLTPVGILSVTVFSIYLLRIFKGQLWMTINCVIFLGGMLVIRILKTFYELSQQGPY